MHLLCENVDGVFYQGSHENYLFVITTVRLHIFDPPDPPRWESLNGNGVMSSSVMYAF